jgi:hypothetical protein
LAPLSVCGFQSGLGGRNPRLRNSTLSFRAFICGLRLTHRGACRSDRRLGERDLTWSGASEKLVQVGLGGLYGRFCLCHLRFETGRLQGDEDLAWLDIIAQGSVHPLHPPGDGEAEVRLLLGYDLARGDDHTAAAAAWFDCLQGNCGEGGGRLVRPQVTAHQNDCHQQE